MDEEGKASPRPDPRHQQEEGYLRGPGHPHRQAAIQDLDWKRTEQFIEFLSYVTDFYPTGETHIILDNFSIHKAKAVQEWLASHPRVRLHRLPCYMPELNPVEKIWWHLKVVVAAHRLYGTMDALTDAMKTFFELLTTSEALTLAA